MINKPLVSIIIPVFNGADYLTRAIESALNQSYDNIEVIVVNDGSTDEGKTEQIAKSYGDRIQYIKKENGGVSSALNIGISAMNGEYFSWLSHDDEYHPDKILELVHLLNKSRKSVALCGTEFIDENSNTLKKKWPMPQNGIYTSKQALKLMANNTFSGVALLIPKKAIIDNGGFDEALSYMQDVDMWRKIFLDGYCLIVTRMILVKSRLHKKQRTHNNRKIFTTERLQIVPVFCERLCSDNYNDVAIAMWYSTLKKGYSETASQIYVILKRYHLVSLKEKICALFYRLYGLFRKTLRYVYYRLVYDINS